MKIGLVGLGLIGGSMGLDLRNYGFEVLGVSRKQKTCQQALDLGAVDEASTDLSLLKSVDLIYICTPINTITPILKQLIPHLQPQTIVTDVGSVKKPVVEECSHLWSNFVGGHPMAGKAEQGIEAAQKGLFIKAAYVLTPTSTTPQLAIDSVGEIATILGCQLSICSPETHDRAVAWISHLPAMVSASLIAACMEELDPSVLQLAQNLASSGFRDTSRVGGGNPELGEMMARYNSSQLLNALCQYRQSLDTIIKFIQQEDWCSLQEFLQATQDARSNFL